MEALEKYGRDWKNVQKYVGTRSTTQTRSHAQKHFAKIDKLINLSKEGTTSQPPTAANSPNCKPGRKTTKGKKRQLESKEDEVEPKVKLLDSIIDREEALMNNFLQEQNGLNETFVQFNECVAQPWYQFQYEPEMFCPVRTQASEEDDFEFDNVLPEPIKPLELSLDFHHPVSSGSVHKESEITIEFPPFLNGLL